MGGSFKVLEDVTSPGLSARGSANLNPAPSLANEPSALFDMAIKAGCPIDVHNYAVRSDF